MHIKILGSGCKKCVALEDNVETAVQAAGINARIEKITDLVAIAKYGVMSTPGLIINENVVSTGRVLPPEEIGKMLTVALDSE